MRIKIDYNNMMASRVRGGFCDSDLTAGADAMQSAHRAVTANIGKGWQEWCTLPDADPSDIISFADSIRDDCHDLVVLGIGGSALGPLAAATALLHLRHNDLPLQRRRAPRLFVEDNIDPERMQALLEVIDIQHTYFNVITKSGETSETLSQFLIIYRLLKERLGVKVARQRIIVTTTIGKGTLYNIAKAEGFRVFGIGAGVGGRFSVLSAVGLLPLGILGVDLPKLLLGAKEMTARCTALADNPALVTAYLMTKSIAKSKNISVMMPYADGLRYMGDFYCQLWGESLGKALDLDGNTVNIGQTPVRALGVTDQHSQLQLYSEGPDDKVITFLGVEEFAVETIISDDPTIDGANFLKGHTLNQLITAERVATTYAVTQAGRSNMTIMVDYVDAYTVGALLTYMMYQTAYAGALLHIDTFNQPGVEESKRSTFALLGRAGYEEKLAEVKSVIADPKYII